MHSFHLSNFLAGLQIAQKKKKVNYTYVNASKFILLNVQILLKLGYIYGYTTKQENNIKIVSIFLKYYPDGTPLINNIKLFTVPSSRKYIKLKDLRRYVSRELLSVYVVSTSIGILDGVDCLYKHKSGLLLYKIN